MPFTFSHPAVVLPLNYLPKGWFSMTGLIIGSMAPDFEKFIRMGAHNTNSHTWQSIFWFNLPLGIVLSFVFHIIVRDVLIDNLPGFLKKRLDRFKNVDWRSHFRKHYFIIIISIIIGAVSHIALDSFTHSHGAFVRWLPFLKARVPIGHRWVAIYNLMQFGGSFIGALIVFYAIMLLPKDETVRQNSYGKMLKYWVTVALVALVVLVFRLKTSLDLHEHRDLLITSISAGLISLIVSPLLLRKSQLQRKP
ncbi:DUF4184 family protein [Pontibacter silvestris]|uniref:DUF4184 family protein n=1 Tax=Pontibacter silvestris TaxID=2305183 RepID=A0ABW4X4X4_9BACT|nr:DUF4184 family protein [Pontibacter silvestris]MCC9134946.1 DUF4184 family protein [Pontibacter silvestris]